LQMTHEIHRLKITVLYEEIEDKCYFYL
jgi:hypothetical protein